MRTYLLLNKSTIMFVYVFHNTFSYHIRDLSFCESDKCHVMTKIGSLTIKLMNFCRILYYHEYKLQRILLALFLFKCLCFNIVFDWVYILNSCSKKWKSIKFIYCSIKRGKSIASKSICKTLKQNVVNILKE